MSLRSSFPALVVVASLLAISSPVLADVPEYDTQPPSNDESESESKPKKHRAKRKAGSMDEAKNGDCSVTDDGANLTGLAALVLLVSGGALLRREPGQG